MSDAILESDHEDDEAEMSSECDDQTAEDEQITRESQTSPKELASPNKTNHVWENQEFIQIVWSKKFCKKMLSGNFVKVSVDIVNEAWQYPH